MLTEQFHVLNVQTDLNTGRDVLYFELCASIADFIFKTYLPEFWHYMLYLFSELFANSFAHFAKLKYQVSFNIHCSDFTSRIKDHCASDFSHDLRISRSIVGHIYVQVNGFEKFDCCLHSLVRKSKVFVDFFELFNIPEVVFCRLPVLHNKLSGEDFDWFYRVLADVLWIQRDFDWLHIQL